MGMKTEVMERAWAARDASFDGRFYFAVKTTGIYCRPSCPSRPRRENLEFFESAGEAVRAGYRACKRCRPELVDGTPPEWVRQLMERVNADPETVVRAAQIREVGVTPERVRRWFQKNYGMTFSAWQRGVRLSRAFTQIRRGEGLDDVVLGSGYGSYSGMREAFRNSFELPPGKVARGGAECLTVGFIETPLGLMVAAASQRALCFLEFADRRGLEKSYERLRKRFGMAVVPGESGVLDQVREEVGEYLRGERREFEVELDLRGSAWEEAAWAGLRAIPYGETWSYRDVASRLGKPGGARAVARACATNRIYLMVPCHRVTGADGGPGGYGGGLWRKERLLSLESEGTP